MSSKNILLAGIAVGALAVAGNAGALTMSGTKVGGITVCSSTCTTSAAVTPYTVASELNSTSGIFSSSSGFVFDAHVSTGNGQLTSGQYLVSYSVTGASFANNPTPTYIGSSSGSTTAVVSTASSATVSYVVTVGAGDSISDIIIAPTLTGITKGTNIVLTETIALATNSALPIDGGSATGTIVTYGNAFKASVGSTSSANQTATIASAFHLFASPPATSGSSATIGSVAYGLSSTTTPTYVDFNGTAASAASISGATVTFTGSVGGSEKIIVLADNGTTIGSSAVNSTTVTLSSASSGAMANVTVVLGTTATSSTTGSALAISNYSVTVTPTLTSSGLASGTTFGTATGSTVALGSVAYEGTSFLAPWQSGASTNGTISNVRIANRAPLSSTGAVTITLYSAVTASAGVVSSYTPTNSGLCTSTQLSKLAFVPANGELSISSSDLATCFGAFTRGDILVTVQAGPDNLTAKSRIGNTSGGDVAEVSLQAFSGAPVLGVH